jgi:uncharacterized protein
VARIAVRVQPRARHDEIVAVREGVLVVRVTAPALEGRANRAVCKLLAERLGTPRTSVTVLRGEHHRDKVLEIRGLAQATVDATLGLN